jgi:hypothetical protein
MIRYPSYSATNFRPTSAQTYLDPLEVQYRELLELRERVRMAEAAAAQRKRPSSRDLLLIRRMPTSTSKRRAFGLSNTMPR